MASREDVDPCDCAAEQDLLSFYDDAPTRVFIAHTAHEDINELGTLYTAKYRCTGCGCQYLAHVAITDSENIITPNQ